MKCPNCKTSELTAFTLNGVQVHTCNSCHGFWFTRNEFEGMKDKIPEDAWLDLDLWDDKEKLVAKQSDRICPACSVPLYSLDWDNSHIVIGICKKCNGIWLDRGEFEKVLKYIDDTADLDILTKYKDTLKKKIKEIFTGPKHLIPEIHDVFTVLNMFQYKFMVANPKLSEELVNRPTL